jgi:hypothetical protein
MREYSDAIKHKFHAICKGKFQKSDHIYLAIHSHSAPIFRLRCISIARKKVLHLCEELILFSMREYSDAIKLPKSYPPPACGGQGLQIK